MENLLKRVLLVEDHTDTRVIMARLLGSAGHQVLERVSAEDAERCLGVDLVDVNVAVLDVNLPGRKGDELARDLKARYPELAVIFVTAESDTERLHQAVADCTVFQKPVNIRSLLTRIGSC